MGKENVRNGKITEEKYDEWLAEYIKSKKAYSDIVFTAFDILNFHTQMTFTELGEMPYHELIRMIEEFKPRLKEIAEAKQASKMNAAFGG